MAYDVLSQERGSHHTPDGVSGKDLDAATKSTVPTCI